MIVIGFSGGPDSLALAAVLTRLRKPARIRVLLAHIDHQLRPSSTADAEACVRLASALDAPIVVETLAPELQARHPGVGIEEAARRERYVALSRIVKENGARLLSLAHQEDDQAETVLLHLLRGAGLRGAAGMAELTEVAIPWWDDPIDLSRSRVSVWRPLLLEPRDVVYDYLNMRGLQPVLDETNEDRSLRRNAIRHSVLPLLEEISPGARHALARYAAIASEEDALLEGLARERLADMIREDGCLDGAGLLAAPLALRRRMVRLWLEDHGLASDLSFERVEAVMEAASPGEPRTIQLGRGWVLRSQGQRLCLVPPPRAATRRQRGGVSSAGSRDHGQMSDMPERVPSAHDPHPRAARMRDSDAAEAPVASFTYRPEPNYRDTEYVASFSLTSTGSQATAGERTARVPSPCRMGGHMSALAEKKAAGIAKILIEEETIQARVRELAAQLDAEYADTPPLMIGVLTGAITFMADLMRAMTVPVSVDFMAVSSYGASTKSSGVVRILKDLNEDVEGRRVLVVEDIVDSGLTLQYLLDILRRRNPADIRVVALLKKEKADAIDVQVDQVGFRIPDEFVVGYGLDFAGKYRNLPYVAVLDGSEIPESI